VGFVRQLKEFHQLSEDAVTWFQLDGEAIQIEPFLKDDVLTLLQQLKIVVGKPPASTTATTQPLDVGNVFRSSKNVISHLTDEQVPMNGVLYDALKAGIKAYEAETKHKLKQGIEQKAVKAILRAYYAISTSVNTFTITKSFRACGVYPFSYAQIMRQCKTNIDKQTLATIGERLPELAEIIRVNGQITEADLDAVGVGHTVAPKKKNKDANIISKRRSVILTNHLILNAEFDRRREVAVKKTTAAHKKATKLARAAAATPV